MNKIPKNLSNARILVTNDDGIDAEGIKILERVAKTFSDDVWVVAPKAEHSGAGHSITLHDPLRIKQLDERRFITSGTPTDCTLLAIREIIPNDKPVDLVLSGINRGMNVADDVTYSGTIAAAMEGTLLGVPSIAFSQSRREKNGHIHWETGEHYTKEFLQSVCGMEISKHTLLSVNFPNVPIAEVKGMISATQGKRKIVDKLDKRVDPKDRVYYWIGNVGFQEETGDPDTDLALLKKNYVTATPINLNMTDHAMLFSLNQRFSSGDE